MKQEKIQIGCVEMLLSEGELRYLRVGGIEVIRRIYMAVRDSAWGTMKRQVSLKKLGRTESGVSAGYVAEHRGEGIAFDCVNLIDANVRTEGDAVDVEVGYVMEGEATKSFMTNRTGVCLLHPIVGVAGEACEVVHPDGGVEKTLFPGRIAPHQPFTDVRGIRQEIQGLKVEIEFGGEVFECEDQRNWGDASFKTYCRPLKWGIPYPLNQGERVRHQVSVRVRGRVASQVRAPRILIGDPVGRLPEIGMASAGIRGMGPASDGEIELLRALNLSHLRVDVPVSRGTGGAIQRVEEAGRLGLPVELAVHLPADPGGEDLGLLFGNVIRAIYAEYAALALPRVIVYRDRRAFASSEDVEWVRTNWPFEKRPKIGGGTMGNFVDVNRNREEAARMDVLAYAVSPQVHSTDDLSVMENVQALGDALLTARTFAPAKELAVGPVVLHRVPDPYAKGNEGRPMLVTPDDRQRTDLAAAWTLGALKHLSEGGASSITIHSTRGAFGVMNEGKPYPVHRVMQWVGEMKGGHVTGCVSSDPLAFEALAIVKQWTMRVIVACMKDEPVEVTIEGIPGGARTVSLGPFEVTMFDVYLERE